MSETQLCVAFVKREKLLGDLKYDFLFCYPRAFSIVVVNYCLSWTVCFWCRWSWSILYSKMLSSDWYSFFASHCSLGGPTGRQMTAQSCFFLPPPTLLHTVGEGDSDICVDMHMVTHIYKLLHYKEPSLSYVVLKMKSKNKGRGSFRPYKRSRPWVSVLSFSSTLDM